MTGNTSPSFKVDHVMFVAQLNMIQNIKVQFGWVVLAATNF
jgi:hypothetical protein